MARRLKEPVSGETGNHPKGLTGGPDIGTL